MAPGKQIKKKKNNNLRHITMELTFLKIWLNLVFEDGCAMFSQFINKVTEAFIF